MKVLGRTQMLSDRGTLGALDVIHELGFDGAEICVERQDWSWERFDAALVAATRDRIAALSLAPCSFSLHQDYIYDDRLLDETKCAIRTTRALGLEVFVFSGTKRRTGDEAEWARMVTRTEALVEVAEACGVTLAEEFEPGFIVGSTADLMRMFEEIPSPRLAANLDLGHVYLCDSDPLRAIAQLGPKIVHCHVENMRAGVHDHLLPQEGDMDLRAHIAALRDAGFTGGLALDVYRYPYEQVAPDAIAYLHDLIESL
ncbi:MAG: sugar phosphate isomerase/epimerase [Anaerolineae bacterium]|nr:sugar phosphate isomerase/epimerase [Anaerolineae bacterium]